MKKIYSRENGDYLLKSESNAGLTDFLYNTLPGRLILKTIIIRPWFSKLIGLFQKSLVSKFFIKSFVEKNNIDVSDYDITSFKSFNDFFIRKKEVKDVYKDPNVLLSPADSKLSVFEFSDDLTLKIKSSIYSINDILGGEFKFDFKPKYCAVFRLSVDDYHRYSYIDDGKIIDNYKIKGVLHTVRPVSEKYKIYKYNSREVTYMQTENFSDIVEIEVGAVGVGKIVNHNVKTFMRLQERGYFEFGGSTIVIFFKDNVEFDSDILENSKDGCEVQVRAGEKIGYKK